MNKQIYKNLIAEELLKIKKENRYRVFNEIKKDDSYPLAKKIYQNTSAWNNCNRCKKREFFRKNRYFWNSHFKKNYIFQNKKKRITF